MKVKLEKKLREPEPIHSNLYIGDIQLVATLLSINQPSMFSTASIEIEIQAIGTNVICESKKKVRMFVGDKATVSQDISVEL